MSQHQMLVIGHIAGIPLEETLLTGAPALFVMGGCWFASLRARLERRERDG
ncbi:MAG TPA: hypothetical protein VGF25_22955 [Thermoleophilaceae bacterium]